MRTLSISNNCIETSGAGYLARGAAINNSLDTIDISGNSIRNEGAIYLGKGITVRLLSFSFSLEDTLDPQLSIHGMVTPYRAEIGADQKSVPM